MAKITLEQIQQEANELGWQLLSEEYKNLKSELKLICPNKHEIFTTYEKWRRAHACPICQAEEKQQRSFDCVVAKSKGEQRILAVDQATHTSGWSIYSNGQLLRHGVFTVNGSEVTRINEVKNWLINMVTVWKIDYVQLEDIQLQEKDNDERMGVTVYKALAHLQGVLENTLFVNNIPYGIVPSGTWRKFLGIKGRGRDDRKRSAQIKVQSLYNLSCGLDEAEAICIGLYACNNQAKQNEMVEWG